MARLELAVVDTHALIWWITGQRRSLGRQARAFTDAVDEGRAVACIPALSLVELDEAIRDGDLILAEPFPTFVERLRATPSRYRVVDLTPEIVSAAHGLFDIPERFDRLIAATALVLRCPLVTRDGVISKTAGIDTVW